MKKSIDKSLSLEDQNEIKKEKEIFEKLQKNNGFFYEETIDPKTKEIEKYINILGIKIETSASEQEVQEISKEIVLTETDQKLLRTIAEAYKLRQPLMIEGDPGGGKTFLIKKFTQLVQGKNFPVLELNGTPRTTELEILGRWVPLSSQESDNLVFKETIGECQKIEEEYQKINKQYDKKYKNINDSLNQNIISQEESNKQIAQLNETFNPLQRRYYENLLLLYKKSADKVKWEFKEGSLLQAYSGREGKGQILLVDEFNIIPSNHQQNFLSIGGEKGGLSNLINFDSKRYLRGKDTWICFAQNFSEKTLGRSEVVEPMTDRLMWLVINKKDTDKKRKILEKTLGGRLKQRLAEYTQLDKEIVFIPMEKTLEWDKCENEQLGEQVADFISLFNEDYSKIYEVFGDKIDIKGQKRKRIQEISNSPRNLWRLYSSLDYFQIRDPITGRFDIVITLKNAIKKHYLMRLGDEELIKKIEDLIDEHLGINIEPKEFNLIKKSEEDLGGEEKICLMGWFLLKVKF